MLLRNFLKYISIFIAIYLYDDRLTLILTIDGETVNISDPLLNTIEDVTSSFLNSSGLPNQYYTNFYYFKGGFAATFRL